VAEDFDSQQDYSSSQSDVTASEERGGGFEGQQNASYGGGGEGSDTMQVTGMSKEAYNPELGPSGWDKFWDTRRVNPWRDALGGFATMLVPGAAGILGMYNQAKSAYGFIKDPAKGLQDMLGNTIDKKTGGALGFIDKYKGKSTGQSQKKSGSGQMPFGGSGGNSDPSRVQTPPSQQSFNPEAWAMLAQMMQGQQSSQPSGRVYQYRGGR